MLVSEGLAELFTQEVTGEASFYSQFAISAGDIQLATACLFDEPCNRSKWFFGADGIPRSFGYAYGYMICREFAGAVGSSAAKLVSVPTESVFLALDVV